MLINSLAQLLSLSAIGSERLVGTFCARLGRGRAAVRLLKLFAQSGRRSRGTLLRLR